MKDLQILISQVDNGFIINVVTPKDVKVLIGDTRESVAKIVESVLEGQHEGIEIPDSIVRSTPGRIYHGPGGTLPKSSEGYGRGLGIPERWKPEDKNFG